MRFLGPAYLSKLLNLVESVPGRVAKRQRLVRNDGVGRGLFQGRNGARLRSARMEDGGCMNDERNLYRIQSSVSYECLAVEGGSRQQKIIK